MYSIDNVTFIRNFPQNDVTVAPRPNARDAQETATERRRAEDELATRVVFGDVVAAAKLRSRYAHRLTAIAYAVLADDAEAERVVEATFEEACAGWPPERGAVERWLTRLVRRQARRRQRVLTGCAA